MGAHPKSIKLECATCGKVKIANCTHTSEFTWRGERDKYRPGCKACERTQANLDAKERNARARRSEKQTREENPHHGLVGGIFRQNRLDWEKYGHLHEQLGRGSTNATSADMAAASSMAMSLGYLNPREHIIAFMDSAYCLELCDLTGLDLQDVKRRTGVE